MNFNYKAFIFLFWIPVIAHSLPNTDCHHPGQRGNVEIKYPQNANPRGPFKQYSALSFQCKRGSTHLRGDTTAVCVNKKWQYFGDDDPRPFQYLVCKEKPCQPRNLVNGNVVLVRKTITYTCDRGYELKGYHASYCRLNSRGNYYVVHPLPQCIKLENCDEPEDENLNILGQCCYAGDKIHFTCADEYRLAGNTSATCKHDGNWSNPLPKCNLINKCINPGYASFSSRQGDDYEIGNSVIYTCNDGYEFINNQQQSKITCLPNKTWSSARPKCKPKGTQICPELPLAENHLVALSRREADVYLPWNEVELDCVKHYTTDAATMSLACFEDGKWDSPIPVCKPLTPCKRPPNIEHGRIVEMVDNPADQFPIDYEINIECDEQYEVKTTKYGSRCLGDDKWENEILNCTLIQCKDPGIPANANRQGDDFHIGKNVTYSCIGNLELIGSEVRTCLETKRWSGFTPVCDSGTTDCHDPGIPLNSRRTGKNFNVGDVVTYHCNQNHLMMGNGTRVCTETGQWSGTEISCLASDEYSDMETVAMELEGTITEVARMSESSIPMKSIQGRGIVKDEMKGVNVYFMFDASGSITHTQFVQSKELAKTLIKKVGISVNSGGVRVGVIIFSKNATTVVHPTTDKRTNIVLDKIAAMKRHGEGTNIAQALEALLSLIATTKRNAERRNCNDVLFLMTDGNANEGGQPTAQAAELHRQKVDTYVVAIGDNIDENTLLLITNGKPENIIKLMKHKDLFTLFSTLIGNTIDYSPCGLDRIKLIREQPKENSNDAKNRNKRSAQFGRIVGGQAVKFAWPWIAAISFMNATGKQFHCGGSIIHTKWILSAAHCFVREKNLIIDPEDTKQFLKKSWIVTIGRISLNDKNSGLDSRVKQIKLHENYDPDSFKNDIALLELISPIQYDIYTRPICLPPPLEKTMNLYKAQKRVVVIGWGHTKVDYANSTDNKRFSTSNILNELRVPIQPDDVCFKPVKYECKDNRNGCEMLAHENTLCAGSGKGGEDACQGDSGGPLMHFATSNNTDGLVLPRWFQVGIVSWGRGCGLPDHYGYYSHVSKLREWIVTTTGVEDFEVVEPQA